MDESSSCGGGGGNVQADFIKKYRNLFDKRDYTVVGGAPTYRFEGSDAGVGVRSLESIPFPKEKKKRKAKPKTGGKSGNKKKTGGKSKTKKKGGKKPTRKNKSKAKASFKEQLLKLVIQM